MHEEVKKFADAGDVKQLKYIFVDCLDVDPTFEKYLDDYNYCAKKGLFDPHEKLSGLNDRQSDWNDDYWAKIKRDLLKNFSRERLDHMRKVALVVLAEKVARLQSERQSDRQNAAPKVSQPPAERPISPPPQRRSEPPGKSKAEQQREEIEAAKRQLAQENAAIEQQNRENKRRRQESLRRQNEDTTPKKSLGIAPLMIIAAVVAVIIFVLLK